MNRLRIVPLDDAVVFPGMPVTLTVDVGGDERVLLGLNDATHLSRDQDMLHIVAADVVSRRSEDPRR